MRHSLWFVFLANASACGGGDASPDAAPAVDGAMVISEVLYDPAGAADADEWVELRNDDTVPIDIGLWRLCGAEFNYFILPADLVLQPGGMLVVHWNTAPPASPEPGHIYTDEIVSPLGNAAGGADKSIALYAPQGAFDDALMMRDFLQWIEGDQARADVAADANLWTPSEFVAGAAEGSSLCFNGGAATGPAGFSADPTPTPLADNGACD